jgi:hypothetical protein
MYEMFAGHITDETEAKICKYRDVSTVSADLLL